MTRGRGHGEELVLEGAIRTGDPRRPTCGRLVLRGGRVAGATGGGGRTLRLPAGAVAVPGFVDPHLHLLACAAARLSVDLTGERSVAEICHRLDDAVQGGGGVGWIRARGYESWQLPGGRSPDRGDLDGVSRRQPVVIHDGSGHEVVCNTAALEALGLFGQRGPGVEIEDGELTGRIYHGEALLSGVPPLGLHDLRQAARSVSGELARLGVTSVTDATSSNGLSELSLLARWRGDGTIAQRVEAMVGTQHVAAASAAGISSGDTIDGIVIGHAKVIVEQVLGELGEHVAAARRHGFPMAFHTLDVETLACVLDVIEGSARHASTPDRLEHLALSLPDQVQRIADADLSVVTQPSFLVHRRARYAAGLSRTEQGWLYRVGSLLRAGVRVAASSDAPVVAARPLEIAAAAVDRTGGAFEGDSGERVDWSVALDLVTRAAGSVGTVSRGVLVRGAPGDVVVLSGCPGARVVNDGRDADVVRVLATVIGGAPIFDPDGLFAPL